MTAIVARQPSRQPPVQLSAPNQSQGVQSQGAAASNAKKPSIYDDGKLGAFSSRCLDAALAFGVAGVVGYGLVDVAGVAAILVDAFYDTNLLSTLANATTAQQVGTYAALADCAAMSSAAALWAGSSLALGARAAWRRCTA